MTSLSFTKIDVVRVFCLSVVVSSSQPQQFFRNEVEFYFGLLKKLKSKLYYSNVKSDSYKEITYRNERYENMSDESVIFFKRKPTKRVSMN